MPFLTEFLDRWAAEKGDDTAFLYLDRGEREASRLTFSTLRRRALGIAAMLTERKPDAPVLLVFPPGLDFVTAFFGCLYAGAVAVPAPYLFPGRKAERIAAIRDDAGCRIVLSVSAMVEEHDDEIGGTLHRTEWLAVDRLSTSTTERSLPRPAADHPAFLQYTSGSTAEPRGVIVTHGNLEAGQSMIEAAFQHGPDSSIVSWLPIYHDMGLIGGVLQPVSLGRPAILMSPLAFLQKPARWLNAITKYRATTSGAPSFAYGLCARMVTPQQRSALDLSAWRIAFCGAEPVRAADIDSFAEAFAPCGFAQQALFPCYGLAEATLFVSGGPAGTGVHRRVADGKTSITSGAIAPGQEIAIVDPDVHTTCAPEAVGEIWLRGRNVAIGYWNRPELTAEIFAATLTGEQDGKRWLRTGDYGAIIDGDLVITGRLKDVIIVRGVKHHPEAIEETAIGAHPRLRSALAAAIAVDRGDEIDIFVLVELGRGPFKGDDLAASGEAASVAITTKHGFRPTELLFLSPGSLPRTTSGKVQRHLAKRMLGSGALAERMIKIEESHLS